MTFSFWNRQKRERELDEELQSHLRMAAKDHADRGGTPEEASSAARRELGNVSLIKEVTREMWGWASVERLMLDVRFGLRMLAKSPGFALVSILTLALGIGANTALFSVVNGVLFNPLPYPHPDQLVWVAESKPNFATGSISFPNFRDWQKDNHTFSSMAAYRPYSYNLTGLGDAEQVRAMLITSDLFTVLGVHPVIGRSFVHGEDEIGAAPIALITAGLWKRKFGSAPDAVGKTLKLDGKGYTIVGVIPASFNLGLGSFQNVDLYVPLGQWSNPLLPKRGAGLGIHGIGRLKPGVSIAQARADMQAVTQGLAAAYPDADKGIGAALISLKKTMVGDLQLFLLVLLAAVGFVLLIGCVNIANLTIARSTGRTREFAIRAALGASQGRLLRQLLTESILLSIAGGALGLLLAGWGTQAALRALPRTLPRSGEVALDSHVLIFTLLISLGCGIFFGLAPAFKSTRANVHDALKERGRSGSGSRHRAQGALVVAEVAMALVLLVAAGLMIRSLGALWSVNPGFDPHNVLTFGVALPPSANGGGPDAARAALRQLNDALASVPGVTASSLSWGAIPLQFDDEDLFWIEGKPKPQSENDMSWALSYVVQEDYLKLMKIPLERGRFLTAQDNEKAPHVIVVDDVFAKQYFPGQDPIGQHVFLQNKGGRAEIIGIVGHVKQWGLDTDDTESLRAQLYFPYMQLPDEAMDASSWSGTGALVRFDPNTPAITDSLRASIRKLSGEHVMYGAETMDEAISASLATRRVSMILLGVFAALALGLASIGIYGVVSYLVGQRTQEIGVRLALGAKRVDVLRLVLGEGIKMASVGLSIGLVAALGLTRLMAGLLYGVSATDPFTFAAVGTLLMMVALAATYIPARRAMSVDPIVALRYE
ncbi:MAG TPA: ABC transporter permease [Candidatus Solibacter sp.]|nr:ABC transporter permease [Candidatus Solibacter sp.]